MRFLLVLVLISVFGAGSAIARDAYKRCDVVHEYADIQYPRSLIVNRANPKEGEMACHFFVYLPPVHAAHIAEAVKDYALYLIIDPILSNLPAIAEQENLAERVKREIEENFEDISECFGQVLENRNFEFHWEGELTECRGVEDMDALAFTVSSALVFSETLYFAQG